MKMPKILVSFIVAVVMLFIATIVAIFGSAALNWLLSILQQYSGRINGVWIIAGMWFGILWWGVHFLCIEDK